MTSSSSSPACPRPEKASADPAARRCLWRSLLALFLSATAYLAAELVVYWME